VKFEFIRAEKANFPIELLCSVLDVSRSGYYAWLDRGQSKRSQTNAALLTEVRAIHSQSRGAYGAPRVHRELRRRGFRVNRKRVERLMRQDGLRGRKKRRYKVTTLSTHELKRFENKLNREFKVEQLNQVWAGDITYLWTTEGWLYLAVVLDLCSRRVIGWALDKHMQEELVVRALEMGLKSRPAPRLFHSDQGSQYASDAFQKLLRKHNIEPSMSRRGNCWDNAVVESFFDSMKTELADLSLALTADRTKTSVFWYLEVFYNRQRLHSTLGYKPPVELEEDLLAA